MTDIEIHLQVIRKALRRGNAAVMVGSGFSLNAEGSHRLNSWLQLAQGLYKELNPDKELPEYMGTSDILRLGEEYVQVHSQAALDEFIREHLPDDKISPGELHRQFLELPWAEIFTTNYDTLLERAAQGIVGRGHLTVLSRQDIPHSRILGRRRIVKLHGSLPSHRPFLFTEEDYRTYPTKFAPFVNLVRQSLLENVFCLVGFSGEDPNFLQWIGWVRDMLDKHSPPIYMFLADPPSHGQERLLSSRHIQAIVLPKEEPKADEGPYAARYRKLFELLNEPRGSAPEDWLEGASIPITDIQTSVADRVKRFIGCIETLTKLRDKYPGWLIAPEDVRNDVERLLRAQPGIEDQWVLDGLPKNEPKAVAVIEEMMWWQQIMLGPVYDNVIATAILALNANQKYASGETAIAEDEQLKSWGVTDAASFKTRWIRLAKVVLTWHREQVLVSGFNEWTQKLSQLGADDSACADYIAYERILLHLYLGKRDTAKDLIKTWQPSARDPYMQVRRCALVAECGDLAEGHNLLVGVIQDIQRSEQSEPESLWLLSREAWACYLGTRFRWALDFSLPRSERPKTVGLPDLERRLIELQGKRLDPRRDIERIQAALNAEATTTMETNLERHEFDLHRSRDWFRMGASSDLREKVLAALKWLALADTVGITPRAGEFGWDIDVWKQAAWWGQLTDSSTRIHSILIRTADTSMLEAPDHSDRPHSKGWFSRYHVATLRSDAAAALCEEALSLAMAHMQGKPQAMLGYKPGYFFLELYSRLVLREKDQEKLAARLAIILNLVGAETTRQSYGVWEPLGHALRRTLETISSENIIKLLPVLLLLDPKPMRDSRFASDWGDWTETVYADRLKGWVTDDARKLVNAAVPQWLAWLKSYEAENPPDLTFAAVKHVWARLYWGRELKIFDETSLQLISKFVWQDQSIDPNHPPLYPWAIFHWPSPPDVDRAVVFRNWLKNQSVPNTINYVVGPDGRKGRPIVALQDVELQGWLHSIDHIGWSEEDIFEFLDSIRNWWGNEWSALEAEILAGQGANRFLGTLDTAKTRVIHIDSWLAAFIAPRFEQVKTKRPELVDWLNSVEVGANKIGAPLWRFKLAIADKEGVGFQELISEWAAALIAGDENQARRIVKNIDWYFNIKKGTRSPLLDPLVTVALAMMLTGQLPQVRFIIDLWRVVVDRRPSLITENIAVQLDLALQSLYMRLTYQERRGALPVTMAYIPDLRDLCARLAIQLYRNNRRGPGVLMWIQALPDDPLPELRHLAARVD